MRSKGQLPPGAAPGDQEFWLALHRAPGLGEAGMRSLVERFGRPGAVFEAAERELEGLALRPETREFLRRPDWEAVARDRAWLDAPGRHLLTLADPRYPPRLREIPDPPPLLFVAGDPEVLGLPQLAIVGSRNPTPQGRETAFAFARAFARAGLVITSGLAAGIDAAAHRGALAAPGSTVAVTGNGPDRVYPAGNRKLAAGIAASGALVSTFPPGTPPLAANFPRRNRVISGLSLGVLVVEAARRSGSLITARLALEQGREVFAVPGSIHNPMARGCHFLIRQGAKLVETARDVFEEIAAPLREELGAEEGEAARVRLERDAADTSDAGATADEAPLDEDYTRLLACLGDAPAPVDLLVQRSGLTAEAVSSMLLILELHGYVAPASGGFYTRTAKRR